MASTTFTRWSTRFVFSNVIFFRCISSLLVLYSIKSSILYGFSPNLFHFLSFSVSTCPNILLIYFTWHFEFWCVFCILRVFLCFPSILCVSLCFLYCMPFSAFPQFVCDFPTYPNNSLRFLCASDIISYPWYISNKFSTIFIPPWNF